MENHTTLSQEEIDAAIAEVLVDNVVNSQNTWNEENNYNPFPSQSQNLSEAELSSNQASESVFLFTAGTESTSEPKRRGRPSREVLSKLEPTRESRRVKKCPNILKYDNFLNDSYKWSVKDNALFLKGCLEVGSQNTDGLKDNYLTHKSEKEISRQIEMWKAVSAEKFKKQLSSDESNLEFDRERLRSLDKWIEYFHLREMESNCHHCNLSQIFAIIAEYGAFPSVEECGGVDARAMYRYLHCIVNGLPPYGINSVTAKVILMCLDNVFEMLNDPDITSAFQEHILNPPPAPDQNKFGKTYCRKGKNAKAKEIDRLLFHPVTNPLALPKEAVDLWNLRDLSLEDD